MDNRFFNFRKRMAEESLQEEPEDNRFVKLVNSLIRYAVQRKASDIHFEILNPDKMRIRIRVDGSLSTIMAIYEKDYYGMVSRIKILSGLDISEKRKPQDGSFCIRTDGRKIDLRVSTIPTLYGEKAVLRILDASVFLIPIEALGFSEENESKVWEMVHKANGLILITGPTGCGKTTTLYSILKQKNTEAVNIVTIEDPVEFHLEGINQMQVNEWTGLNFEEGLHSILRQDPNVIMVGEIRDEQTAATAVRASITGHLVLSTLHTNDALSTINRLLDMGVQDYLLSTALKGIISQRLLRRLCPFCKEPYKAAERECRLLDVEKNQILYRPVGCERCGQTGFYGRKGIFEVLLLSQSLREAIHSGSSYDVLKKIALDQGLVLFSEVVKNEILNGVTSVAEGMRIMSYGNDEHSRI